MLDEHKLPLWRGVKLDQDDHIRRAVIMQLICHFHLEFARIEQQFGIVFRDYFLRELERLQEFVDDGLLLIHDEGMEVTPLGRLLIRNICTTFDRYLSDISVVAENALKYAKMVHIVGDGKDAWIFDVDDTLLSFLRGYQTYGFGYVSSYH